MRRYASNAEKSSFLSNSGQFSSGYRVSSLVCIGQPTAQESRLTSSQQDPAHPFGQAVLVVEFPAHPEDREDDIG